MLLPADAGFFGRWDWVANGLFAICHLHMPWAIPQTFLVDTFVVAGLSRRYRSALMGIAVHSAQSVSSITKNGAVSRHLTAKLRDVRDRVR